MSVYITKGPTKSHLTHCFSNYVKNIFGLTDKFNSPISKSMSPSMPPVHE